MRSKIAIQVVAILSVLALAVGDAAAQRGGSRGGGGRSAGMRSGGMRGSGFRSSGMRSSGLRSSGMRNSSFRSSGMRSSGSRNSGFRSTGTRNSGFRSSGTHTRGFRSSGIQSSGGRNNGARVGGSRSGSHHSGAQAISAPRAFGVNRGGLGINHGTRPSTRPSAYRSTHRAGQPVGGGRNLGSVQTAHSNRPGHGHGSGGGLNHWRSPRTVGHVPGFRVGNYYCNTRGGGKSLIGCGPGSRYGRGYCGPGFGYPYYGYNGGCSWRYPLYLNTNYGFYGGIAYDAYVYDEGYDVFEPLAADVEMTEEEIAVADEALVERNRAAIQSEALDEFGHKQAGGAEAPNGMSPEAQARAQEIGEALGQGDRAFEEGRYDEARDKYVRAVVLAGEDSSVRIALGLAEFALGSYGDSSSAIRRGVARSPSLASSSFELRAVYGKQEDFEAHRRVLEDHVAANPDDVEAKFLLGFVNFYSGNREEGKQQLAAYLDDPRHDDAVREFIMTAQVAMPR